ncbi:Uncharacterised protein [Chlamydia trachomatis]|nr:Uncharacterised protein [Chlamydia trachomatis]
MISDSENSGGILRIGKLAILAMLMVVCGISSSLMNNPEQFIFANSITNWSNCCGLS